MYIYIYPLPDFTYVVLQFYPNITVTTYYLTKIIIKENEKKCKRTHLRNVTGKIIIIFHR